MECSTLNIILVVSFAFVSVALGVKWATETFINYALAKQGMQMQVLTQEEFRRMMEEDEDDDSTG